MNEKTRDCISIADRYQPIASNMLEKVSPEIKPHIVERDRAFRSYTYPTSSNPPSSLYRLNDIECLVIPSFMIGLDLVMVDDHRKEVVEDKMKDSVERMLDLEVIKCLHCSVSSDHTITIAGHPHLDAINLGASLIEEHDLKAINVLVHPYRYRGIKKILVSEDLKLHCSTMVPRNCVYITAAPEVVGRLVEYHPIEARYHDVEVKFPDGRRRTDTHLTVEGEYGMGVINDYAVSMIVVCS